MNVLVPVRTVSEANVRHHWRQRHARAAEQRFMTRALVRGHRGRLALPVTVTFVRLGSRDLDDDNLRGALKAVRDGVADAFDLANDNDPRITWKYEQARGGYGVRVVIEARAT
jgi:hypothetical protein